MIGVLRHPALLWTAFLVSQVLVLFGARGAEGDLDYYRDSVTPDASGLQVYDALLVRDRSSAARRDAGARVSRGELSNSR